MLKGSLVALITPMNQDGSINYEQLRDLIDWHIKNGTDGIVAVGTTGESATLPVEEHLAVIEATVKHVNKRIPVIAGTGANNTVEAIALSQAAEQAGADYTLSVVPYYNKPSQEGIYQHFKAIAEATSIPMVIYNVPGRTVVSMSNDTIFALGRNSQYRGCQRSQRQNRQQHRINQQRSRRFCRFIRRRSYRPALHAVWRSRRSNRCSQRCTETLRRHVPSRP